MELTTAEKRDLIERVSTLTRNNVLNRDDRDLIFRVCMAACSRELARMREEG